MALCQLFRDVIMLFQAQCLTPCLVGLASLLGHGLVDWLQERRLQAPGQLTHRLVTQKSFLITTKALGTSNKGTQAAGARLALKARFLCACW